MRTTCPRRFPTLRNTVRQSVMQKERDQSQILDCLSSKREGAGGSL